MSVLGGAVGPSLVILSLTFACAALIRRWSRPLRKLFMPTVRGYSDRQIITRPILGGGFVTALAVP